MLCKEKSFIVEQHNKVDVSVTVHTCQRMWEHILPILAVVKSSILFCCSVYTIKRAWAVFFPSTFIVVIFNRSVYALLVFFLCWYSEFLSRCFEQLVSHLNIISADLFTGAALTDSCWSLPCVDIILWLRQICCSWYQWWSPPSTEEV